MKMFRWPATWLTLFCLTTSTACGQNQDDPSTPGDGIVEDEEVGTGDVDILDIADAMGYNTDTWQAGDIAWFEAWFWYAPWDVPFDPAYTEDRAYWELFGVLPPGWEVEEELIDPDGQGEVEP